MRRRFVAPLVSSSPVPLPDIDFETIYSAIPSDNGLVLTDKLVDTAKDIKNGNDLTAAGAKRPIFAYKQMIFNGGQSLSEAMANLSFNGDSEGEFFFMAAKSIGDKVAIPASWSHSSRTTIYIYLAIGAETSGKSTFIRADNQGIIADPEHTTASSLGWQFMSMGVDGGNYFAYQNGQQVTLKAILGSLTPAQWLDKSGIINFAIGSVPRTAEGFTDMSLAYLAYSPTKLSDQDRNDLIKYLKDQYFGSQNPPNLSLQTYTPTYTLQNTRYNWDGGIAKNPTNGKVISIWSEGTSHYNQNDLHDINAQISNDGGLTFGTQFTVAAHAPNESFSNPSLGYGVDGRFHCVYAKLTHTTSPYTYIGMFGIFSDDDGASWSAETKVTGAINPIAVSCSKIIEGTDGNLYTTYYEGPANAANHNGIMRSTDNGISWSKYSTIDTGNTSSGLNNEYVTETGIELIAPNTFLCLTRVNGKGWYNQYISTDNCATWTKQGRTSFNDYWQDYNSQSSSSETSGLIRLAKFTLDGIDCVAAIYMNRGTNVLTNEQSYMHVIFGRVDRLISDGVNGFNSAAGIKWTTPANNLRNLDGYPDIIFPNGDTKAVIRAFQDTAPQHQSNNGNNTLIHYFTHEFDKPWLRKILEI